MAVLDQLYTAEIRRTFKASPQRLFKAWTDPKALMIWLTPGTLTKCTFADVDLKVGGKFRIVLEHPDGDVFASSGVYNEVDPPKRLVFTWHWDNSPTQPTESQVSLDFSPRGEDTELRLIHSKLASSESVTQHTQGWTGCLNGLETYISATQA